MIINQYSYKMPVLLCLLLSGCATTGDPNQGGLFGWSEDKARTRQNHFNQEAYTNRQAADGEHQFLKRATDEREQLVREQAALDSRIEQQIKENKKLLADLDLLIRKKNLNNKKKSELLSKLKHLRITPVAAKGKKTALDEQVMERKNQELVEAIKVLNTD